jgi:hypothetical protein
MLDRPPAKPATARQARYRARQRADRLVVSVELTLAVVGMLIDLQWLPPAQSEDRAAIAASITALLEDAARHRQR